MKKKGLLLCVCQGTCPSFKGMDIFEVANSIRREKLVDFVAVHPQLCAEDGDEFLKFLLKDRDIDALFIAACDPKMQGKMFKDAFKEANLDTTHFYGIDIRNMKTEEAAGAIKKLIVKNLHS
jgi:heterodisulfide reductase subunit A-like polyferredoxin